MIQDAPDEYESMQNAYFYFMQTVSCLNRSIEEQCEIMGWFNVAYELHLDSKVVDCLITQKQIKFTAEELEQMTRFSNSLQDLAPHFLGTGGSKSENIANMQAGSMAQCKGRSQEAGTSISGSNSSNIAILNQL